MTSPGLFDFYSYLYLYFGGGSLSLFFLSFSVSEWLAYVSYVVPVIAQHNDMALY